MFQVELKWSKLHKDNGSIYYRGVTVHASIFTARLRVVIQLCFLASPSPPLLSLSIVSQFVLPDSAYSSLAFTEEKKSSRMLTVASFKWTCAMWQHLVPPKVAQFFHRDSCIDDGRVSPLCKVFSNPKILSGVWALWWPIHVWKQPLVLHEVTILVALCLSTGSAKAPTDRPSICGEYLLLIEAV